MLEGDEVSPFYDPMIAKLIVWDRDRNSALARTASALRDYQISGVTTNINFLYDLATCKPFVNAKLDTGFIEKHSDDLFNPVKIDLTQLLSQAAVYLTLSTIELAGPDPWGSRSAWRMNQKDVYNYDLVVGEQSHNVEVERYKDQFFIRLGDTTVVASGRLHGSSLTTTLDGHKQQVTVAKQNDGYIIFGESGASAFEIALPDIGESDKADNSNEFTAPMNGTIVEVLVGANEDVVKGQVLVIMEAMKMQHTMRASSDGKVSELFCSVGDLVDGGTILLAFAADHNQAEEDAAA